MLQIIIHGFARGFVALIGFQPETHFDKDFVQRDLRVPFFGAVVADRQIAIPRLKDVHEGAHALGPEITAFEVSEIGREHHNAGNRVGVIRRDIDADGIGLAAVGLHRPFQRGIPCRADPAEFGEEALQNGTFLCQTLALHI